ncbi:gamma-interferon-inducible lysosomal thiol reductase-like [Cydia amplana]|uniref:gamma-interferon-inducible lysosomal thiol reductase-like n=1 Tax=Cydia amplana TaxID=1869771 RepID=UPI002FE689EA
MCVKLSAVLFQTVLLLIINVSNISEAQHHRYPRYFAQRNHRALQVPSQFKDTVSLKVYYESHCPGSVKFFKEQLAPSLERLGRHLEVLMIPYGHAKTYYENGRYTFECQHGDVECYGNMLHACAIDVARNNTKAALFNACIMERTNDYNTLNYLVNSCGHQYNISAYAIWETMNTGRGAMLLKGYGDETHALRPRYVPYVVLDGAVADSVTTNHLGYFACRLLNPRLSACDTGL